MTTTVTVKTGPQHAAIVKTINKSASSPEQEGTTVTVPAESEQQFHVHATADLNISEAP